VETNILKTALTVAHEENYSLKVEIEAFKILARNLIKSNRLLMVTDFTYLIYIG
jgi:hypothetical protein